MMSGVIIPLRDAPGVYVDVEVDNLPPVDEALDLLKHEQAQLPYWIQMSLAYYRTGKEEDFVTILKHAEEALTNYDNSDRDEVTRLDFLAAYYLLQTRKLSDKMEKQVLFNKASELYNASDKIRMYDSKHLLGRAYFCLLQGNKWEEANSQFTFVLNTVPDCIAALLGLACIHYNKKNYEGSLKLYKKVLGLNSNCSANALLGMGICYFKLGKLDKARISFERALSKDSLCIGAVIGLAVLELNIKSVDSIRNAIQILSRAYMIDKSNSMVLNHLAEHFFFKKEYDIAEQLATHALWNTETESMKAQSCFLIAKASHIRGDYNQALKYYYQSTLFAEKENYILPYYGLGQMHIYFHNLSKAVEYFEEVLKIFPNDTDTMRILSSIYASSPESSKREKAKNFLKKVVQELPDDYEAWIELAQLLEESDITGSLSAYGIAMSILNEESNEEGSNPPEILNNIGSLHYRLGNILEAKRYYEVAMEKILTYINHLDYYKTISVTIRYNLGRINEILHRIDEAENIYRDILQDHSNYIDCYLRLGCIAQRKGLIYEASDLFKEAIRINQGHPEAWSLLGNLHLAKGEWGPAQKKFEHILKQFDTTSDTYALIALGNIWLHTLFLGKSCRDRDRKHQDRAFQFYCQVLKIDPKNIWAANGIGCVLAHKGFLTEARNCFFQIREVTSVFPDVWLNIAHTYVAEKKYITAIAMYESFMKKFMTAPNVEILLYLARAYFKCGKLQETKVILSKCCRVAPRNTLLMHNLALVLQQLALANLQKKDYHLQSMTFALKNLDLAEKFFHYLGGIFEKIKQNPNTALIEAKRCQDFKSQAQCFISRAIKLEEESKLIRSRKKEEEEAYKNKLLMLEKEEEVKRIQLLEKYNIMREQFNKKKKSIFKKMRDEALQNDKSKLKKTDVLEPESDDSSTDQEENLKINTRSSLSELEASSPYIEKRKRKKKRKKERKIKNKRKRLSSREYIPDDSEDEIDE